MKRILTQLKAIRAPRERGTIMILTAVMLTGMLGILALSLDLGFVFSARTQFQSGIDVAALAAGSALRVTIEADAAAPQQREIAIDLAKEYAGQNQVRRYADPPDAGTVDAGPNPNNLVLNDSDVTIDLSTSDLPRVRVSATIDAPLFFGGMFGFDSMNIGATSTVTLLPVDGGRGTIGSGTGKNGVGAGCWRPLILPDTFRDSSGVLQVLGEVANGAERDPKIQAGDYYRSRFAAGQREVAPFVDSFGGSPVQVTGLRDTNLASEIGVKTVMGRSVTFRREYYFIADFSNLPRDGFDPLSVGDIAKFGYCGQLRVGDDIRVYSINDGASYEQVRLKLQNFLDLTLLGDRLNSTAETQYHYVESLVYPGPNSHGAIIPVLFYDPIIWQDPNAIPGINQLRITNIGLLFLQQVSNNGDLTGTFVREIITGGTPIAASNFLNNGAGTEEFSRRWLPMAVQLIK